MDLKTTERLVRLRKEHNYSQEQLADKLGVSRQAISKWERGESSPDTDNLIALAVLYGISLDEMLQFNKEKSGAKPDDEQSDAGAKSSEYDTKNNSHQQSEYDDFLHIRADGGEEVRFGKNGLHVDDGQGNRVEIAPFKINVHTYKNKKSADYCSHCADCDDEDDCNDGCEHGYKANEKVNYKFYENADGNQKFGNATIVVDGKNVFHCGGCANLSRSKKNLLEVSNGLVLLGTLLTFLLCGFLLEDGWRYSWLALFILPTVSTFISAVVKKRPSEFAFPFLVLGTYLALGMVYGLWHPMWALFFVIPIYYIALDILKHIYYAYKTR